MKENNKKYLITAALPYANGPLHIGHIAGAYLPADIYVRYLRANNKDVAFICGSDEHGAAITIKAQKENTTPQAIVDKFHQLNKKAFEDFGIAFSIYHRTSSTLHHETSQGFFKKLYENGALTQIESEQFYDEKVEQFLADRYIKGECPNCHYEDAYGDQCEKCGSSLNPSELINPKSTITGNSPILKKTKHWYLPMNEHEKWIKKWIEEGLLEGKKHHNPKEWKTHVLGQCKSWIDGGLQPRAMTRDLNWGVKVPLKDAEGKVLYVWLDAPIGYISATKQWASQENKNWEDYWKEDDTKIIHFIGKDNIVFHCIIFPILLKAHGEYNLPNNIPANAFLNLEGDKLSTSRNWAVWLHEYLEDFPEKQDVLRYVLTSIAPENKDSEFTWEDFQARNNNELVAILGNFINRAFVLAHKYFDGLVPELRDPSSYDQEVLSKIKEIADNVSKYIEAYKFREAQNEVISLARIGNKYLADTEPWKLIKDNKSAVGNILNVSIQISAGLSILLEPFLPFTSVKLSKMIYGKSEKIEWADLNSTILVKPGSELQKPTLLFEKIEDQTIEDQINKLKSKVEQKKSEVIPLKAKVDFEDFSKLDIRTATVIAAEKVPKTKKLLKLELDTGIDKRTVISGIAEHYDPEELINQQVCLLANLAPKKIKGIESHGMILMAEDSSGNLKLVSPTEKTDDGCQVK